MPFAAGIFHTNLGKAIWADRVRTTPATYTTAPKFCAIGTGATGAARTAAVTDTALSTEVETRTSGTESVVTLTLTGDTTQVSGTVTATAPRANDEAGLFTNSSGPSMAVSATYLVVNLNTTDSITNTWQIKNQ